MQINNMNNNINNYLNNNANNHIYDVTMNKMHNNTKQ